MKRPHLPLWLALLGVLVALVTPAVSGGQAASADLRVTFSGPRDGNVGDTLVYSWSVTNIGPSEADDVTAWFNVPPSQFADASVTTSRGGCGPFPNCGFLTMPAGADATGTLSLRVVSRQPTIISFSARSPTADPTPDANSVAIPVFHPAPPPPPPAGPDPGVPALQPELPVAVVGHAYKTQIQVTGGGPPFRFSLGGCERSPPPPPPPGFTVSREGVVEFTPTVVGNWDICLTVSDSYRGGRSFRGLRTVLRVREPLAVRKPAKAMTGTPYESPFVTGGQGPYRVTFTKGELPRGLRETDMWTRLVGKPQVSGAFPFEVDVEDSLGLTAKAAWVLRVRVGRGLPLRANEQLTPGRVMGLGARCGGAAPAARTVTGLQRSRLLAAYGVWWKPSLYVIDHLIPVELGGHPTHDDNLWPQLAERARRTDALEQTLLRKVCSRTMSLRAARETLERHKLNVG